MNRRVGASDRVHLLPRRIRTRHRDSSPLFRNSSGFASRRRQPPSTSSSSIASRNRPTTRANQVSARPTSAILGAFDADGADRDVHRSKYVATFRCSLVPIRSTEFSTMPGLPRVTSNRVAGPCIPCRRSVRRERVRPALLPNCSTLFQSA